MSNLGKWDKYYKDVDTPQHYGPSASYKIGGDFLVDCATVEDWGCGLGWFRDHIDPAKYIGVDGTASKFADKVEDLETYTSGVEGIFMRHVLEHNYNWRDVFSNALNSFTKKMVLVLYTPFIEDVFDKEIDFAVGHDVPVLSLNKKLVEAYLNEDDLIWRYNKITSPETYYGEEHIYLLSKER